MSKLKCQAKSAFAIGVRSGQFFATFRFAVGDFRYGVTAVKISILTLLLLVTTISVGSLNFYCQKLNADWDDQNQDLQRLIDDMPKSENGPV